MKIDEGIGFIELHDVINDVPMVFRPTVLWDDKDVILIDTGYPGQLEAIRKNLEKLPNGKLTKIIITHHDYDHLGSLYEVMSGSNHKIEVYAHELTKAIYSRRKTINQNWDYGTKHWGRSYDFRWSGIAILRWNICHFHTWTYSGSYKLVPSFY